MFNRRIETLSDTDGDGVIDKKTIYSWDGSNVALDFVDADGDHNSLDGGTTSAAPALAERYVWGQAVDQLLAQETVSNGSPADVSYIVRDNLGSTRSLVDSAGDVVSTFSYDSYGNVTVPLGSITDTRFLYTCQEYDLQTGLSYYNARWYSPTLGRFISEDPMGFAAGDANLYRYVGNNSTTYVDPSGLCKEDSGNNRIELLQGVKRLPPVDEDGPRTASEVERKMISDVLGRLGIDGTIRGHLGPGDFTFVPATSSRDGKSHLIGKAEDKKNKNNNVTVDITLDASGNVERVDVIFSAGGISGNLQFDNKYNCVHGHISGKDENNNSIDIDITVNGDNDSSNRVEVKGKGNVKVPLGNNIAIPIAGGITIVVPKDGGKPKVVASAGIKWTPRIGDRPVTIEGKIGYDDGKSNGSIKGSTEITLPWFGPTVVWGSITVRPGEQPDYKGELEFPIGPIKRRNR